MKLIQRGKTVYENRFSTCKQALQSVVGDMQMASDGSFYVNRPDMMITITDTGDTAPVVLKRSIGERFEIWMDVRLQENIEPKDEHDKTSKQLSSSRELESEGALADDQLPADEQASSLHDQGQAASLDNETPQYPYRPGSLIIHGNSMSYLPVFTGVLKDFIVETSNLRTAWKMVFVGIE